MMYPYIAGADTLLWISPFLIMMHIKYFYYDHLHAWRKMLHYDNMFVQD
jgi:hypothetical protein